MWRYYTKGAKYVILYSSAIDNYDGYEQTNINAHLSTHTQTKGKLQTGIAFFKWLFISMSTPIKSPQEVASHSIFRT